MRYVLVISVVLWIFLIALAVYEWEWLVVLAGIAMLVFIWGSLRQRLPSAGCATTTKEDDA